MNTRTINLCGKWSVNKLGKNSKSITASVPGDIHGDLLAAGAIPDPFYRDNEKSLYWIGETNWVYTREFDVDIETMKFDRLLLQCDGIDTFSKIKVNGKVVGKTENQFRKYEFDIKNLLKPGRNTISVTIFSAVKYAAKRQKERPIMRWKQPGAVMGAYWVRKSQCNWGWDWAPALVTSGIWRPMRIAAFNKARLRDLSVRQKHSRGKVNLTIALETERISREKLSAEITLSLNGKSVAKCNTLFSGEKTEHKMEIKNPQLWWPNGMGGQPLYELNADLLDKNGNLLDTSSKRIGLRELKLVRKKDKWGEGFRFETNGVPFFAKGANWIPTDAVLSRTTTKKYRDLLWSAAAANMNMVRVWGGGIYEEDSFYNICDELGLTVWQDFMFACASYPVDEKDFCENVRAEAEDNIRRIRHHACLALWCGNNEMMGGGSWENGRMPLSDYRKMWHKLLPDTIAKLDPDRDYWPASPFGPEGDPNNESQGDSHLWNVWHGGKPFEWFRTSKHRFCSEFGFQSLPEMKTVDSFAEDGDKNICSFIFDHHQRSEVGNGTIISYITKWYRMPYGFMETIWLSQLQQGMAIKYATEHWRRNMPRCMGALYWQLNDVWPCASWSSIDYFGRWKALHYFAKRFNAPILLSAIEDATKSTVELHLSNDTQNDSKGMIEWTVTNYSGRILQSGKKRATVRSGRCGKQTTLKLSDLVEKHDAKNLMIWLQYRKGKDILSSDVAFLVKPKHIELEEPKLVTNIKALSKSEFAITIKCNRPALWITISLENDDALFSDNWFCLRPGIEKNIVIKCKKGMSKTEFAKSLRVTSLIDSFKQ